MGSSYVLENTGKKDGTGKRSRKLEAVSNVFFSGPVVLFFFLWPSGLCNVYLVNQNEKKIFCYLVHTLC